MPGVLLPVTHRIQRIDGLCLAVSAQMVLEYLGEPASESDLIARLQIEIPLGTPFPMIERVQNRRVTVRLASLTDSQLRLLLDQNRPVICRVWTVMLPYWRDENVSHVAVVVGYDDRYVYLNDPAFPDAPQRVLWDGFLAAWEEYDRMAAIIQPSAR
ncbi:MAG: C39 family peptidase [Chloroflexi bacterium]|nr:C39 family peptidase [Chloroflexota bacterium]